MLQILSDTSNFVSHKRPSCSLQLSIYKVKVEWFCQVTAFFGELFQTMRIDTERLFFGLLISQASDATHTISYSPYDEYVCVNLVWQETKKNEFEKRLISIRLMCGLVYPTLVDVKPSNRKTVPNPDKRVPSKTDKLVLY